MTPRYTGILGVLYDWQTGFAGLLALAAGLLAYFATQRQTHHLQREAKRQLARDVVVAARLIEGVLGGLEDDIRSLEKIWHQPSYASKDATIPASHKALLRKPPLAVVWENLGRFSPDVISNYMNLDTKIEHFRGVQMFSAEWYIKELQVLTVIVNGLRELVGREVKLANDTLRKTEYDVPPPP